MNNELSIARGRRQAEARTHPVTLRIAKKINAAVDNMAIATGIFTCYDMMGQFLAAVM